MHRNNKNEQLSWVYRYLYSAYFILNYFFYRKDLTYLLSYLQQNDWFLKKFSGKTLRVLDVGCGNAFHLDKLIVFCAVHRINLEYTGLDLSLSVIQRNQKKFPNQRFLHQNFLHYASTNVYDVVLMLRFLSLFKFKDQVLEQVNKLINGGALIYMVQHNCQSGWRKLIDAYCVKTKTNLGFYFFAYPLKYPTTWQCVLCEKMNPWSLVVCHKKK